MTLINRSTVHAEISARTALSQDCLIFKANKLLLLNVFLRLSTLATEMELWKFYG